MPSARAAALWVVATSAIGLALSFAVLGLGWVLSKVFPVTVFQGAVVFTGAIGVAALSASATRIAQALFEIQTAFAAWLAVEGPEMAPPEAAESGEPAEAKEPASVSAEAPETPEPTRPRRQVH